MSRFAELADGTKLEFPDETSDDVIQATVKRMLNPTSPPAPTPAPPPEPQDPSLLPELPGAIGSVVKDYATGIGKGALNTAAGLGEIANKIGIGSQDYETPIGTAKLDSFGAARAMAEPDNPVQATGKGLEQVGEFLAVPASAGGSAVVKGALGALSAGALSKVQGASNEASVVNAALSVIPAGTAIAKTGEYVGSKAMPLVRAAIKPTVAAMRKVSGASVEGLNAKADQMVRFIVENKVTSAEKARNIIVEAERELQRALSLKSAPVDAPARAIRYLAALERSAQKQGLPAQDVASIRNAAAEVLDSGLGKDSIKMVMQNHPTLVDPQGNPIQVLTPKTIRELRTDVTPKEALERARANSKWDTRKSWGEQKGAQMEASKAVERALRDSVKAAVPEAAPILKRQGNAIQTEKVLDRMAFRQANRDAVSLPATLVGAGELAQGKLPTIGWAANWLRNNQLKAGVWSSSLDKAIKNGNAPLVADILQKVGVGSLAQAELAQAEQ